MNIWDAILLFYVFWSFYFTLIAKDWFGQKFLFLKDPAFLNAEHASGFIRKDRKNWRLTEFFLVGVLLFPIRMLCIGLLLVGSKSVCRIIQFFMGIQFKDFEEGVISKKFVEITQFIIQKTIRVILFFMGYFKKNSVVVQFDEKKYPNLKKVCKISEWKRPFLIL